MAPILSRLETTAQGGDNGAMEIQLNGAPHPLAGECSIAEFLEQAGLATRRVADEVNGEIVPRGAHATHQLHAGDKVEIVHALGGG